MLDKKIAFIFFLCASSMTAKAKCHIDFYQYLFKSSHDMTKTVIKDSTCDPLINTVLIKFFNTTEGSIRTQNITQYIPELADKNVSISPEIINVISLKNYIQKNLSTDIKLQSYRAVRKKTFALDTLKHLNFECRNCDTPGKKEVKISTFNNGLWCSIITEKRYEVLKTKRNLSHASRISIDDLEKDYIYSTKPLAPYNDLSQIRFYKTTRPLRKGAILTQEMLKSIDVIKRNQRVKTILESSGIQIKTFAIARENGHLGDYIQLVNPRTKKKYTAKIIDFNTVAIKL